MPIKVPANLPAKIILSKENVFIMDESRAITQDIRPLKILILNLMPRKIETETQLLRLLGNTPLQLEIELMQTSTYTPKNTSQEHLLNFYKTFQQIKHRKFDGLVITGAPVETVPFENVDYWSELCEIMDWSTKNVFSTLHICWGAQAGLYHHYAIPKYQLDNKLFGVFSHSVDVPEHMLLYGFDNIFYAPHSRHTSVRKEDIAANPNLRILSSSEKAGVYLVASKLYNQFFVMGHSEYDVDTLAAEYFRDRQKSENISLPENYFPDNNTAKTPMMLWRAHSNLLFGNWLNHFVYQQTPFDYAL